MRQYVHVCTSKAPVHAWALDAAYEHADIKVLKEMMSGRTPSPFIICSSSCVRICAFVLVKQVN
jgi:hypothetical protein